MKKQAIFLFLVLCSCRAEGDGDGEHSDEHSEFRRKMDVKVEDKHVEIKANSKQREDGEKSEDHLEFRIEVSDGDMIKAHLKYFVKSDDSKSKFGMRFKIAKIIEYQESEDGVDGFELGVDDIVWEMEKVEWDEFQDLTTEPDGDDPKLYEFVATTEDGVVKVTGLVSEGITEVSEHGIELDPESIEIIIGIKNFPFMEDGSRVAIIAKVSTRQKMNEFEGEGKLELDIGENLFASIIWDKTLTCDGEDVAVTTSKQSKVDNDGDDADEDENFMKVFSFLFDEHPTECSWDPKLSLLGSGGNTNTIGFSLFITILAISAAMFN